MCMWYIFLNVFSSPPCFHLPFEYAKLVSECSRLRRADDGSGSNVVWIHKPVAQSQGRGIFLFRVNRTINNTTGLEKQNFILVILFFQKAPGKVSNNCQLFYHQEVIYYFFPVRMEMVLHDITVCYNISEQRSLKLLQAFGSLTRFRLPRLALLYCFFIYFIIIKKQ